MGTLELTLGEKQRIFTKCLGQLIEFVYSHPGWTMTMAEGYIGDSIDKPGEDTPHIRTGNHFKRLAIDLNLFVWGKWITDSLDPVWMEIGAYWESLHPSARWGGRFTKVDGNHFSFYHDGKA